MAKLLR